VRHTAAELEQLLARIAITLVLRDRVRNGLLRQAVLQLERIATGRPSMNSAISSARCASLRL
jgi:hypothetical protein